MESPIKQLFEEIKRKAKEIYMQLSRLGEDELKTKLQELADLLQKYYEVAGIKEDVIYALTPWGSIPVHGPSVIEVLRRGVLTPEVMVLLELLAGD